MSVLRQVLTLAAIASLTFVPSSSAETATVTGVSRIYLRRGPGTSFEPNGVVAEGQPVTTVEQVGNWHRVETADGRTGYIYGGYLSFAGVSPQPPPSPPAVGEAPPVPEGAPPDTATDAGEPSSASISPSPDVESWEAELASLKAEVARLRSEVGDATPGLTLPTRGPVEISSTPSETSNLRTAGIAVFFLIVGWVFGAGFARRRSRSQRGRLRF